MSSVVPDTVAARERLLRTTPVALALIAVAAGCWAVTVDRMQGMDMGPGTALGGIGWFATVWVTMMAAMMLPSLVPMAATHVRASRAAGAAAPLAAAVFVAGYLAVWLAGGLVAYAAFDLVRSFDVSWLGWQQGGRYVAGAVILAAALYELTPAKAASLSHCRVPALLARRWRPGLGGAARTGLEHGGFCVGSSWALMAALFALGVMSVPWMIVVAALVAIEKLLPWERTAVGATAVFVAALAIAVALAPDQVPGLTIPM